MLLNSNRFSYFVRHCWDKREKDVASTYAVTGWLVCVVLEVRTEVQEYMGVSNRLNMGVNKDITSIKKKWRNSFASYTTESAQGSNHE